MKAFVVIAGLAGCAATSIDQVGIACAQDSDCPAETWCDLRFRDNVCRELSAIQPPKIVFDGLLLNDQIVSTLTVPTHTVTFHEFRVHDEGSETDAVFVITAPECVDASSSTRSDGELIRAGATFDGEFTTFPDPGCASPATLAFEVTASGRVFTFSTTIQIAP
jgi:hypothetical protein